MSSWITVPALPDSMVKALQRGRQPAAAAKSAPPAPTRKKPAYKVTPFYTGPRSEGPAGFLKRQAENPTAEPQGPQSFEELSRLIYQK